MFWDLKVIFPKRPRPLIPSGNVDQRHTEARDACTCSSPVLWTLQTSRANVFPRKQARMFAYAWNAFGKHGERAEKIERETYNFIVVRKSTVIRSGKRWLEYRFVRGSATSRRKIENEPVKSTRVWPSVGPAITYRSQGNRRSLENFIDHVPIVIASSICTLFLFFQFFLLHGRKWRTYVIFSTLGKFLNRTNHFLWGQFFRNLWLHEM